MIFNSTEREGVLVMLLLITGLIVIPRFVRSGKPAFFLLPEVINIEKDSLRPVSHREISPPLELNTADSSALVRIRESVLTMQVKSSNTDRDWEVFMPSGS